MAVCKFRFVLLAFAVHHVSAFVPVRCQRVQRQSAPPHISMQMSTPRSRRWLVGAAAPALVFCATRTANAVDQQVKTSEDIRDYGALTGQGQMAPLGLGTMAGKSRPVTGVRLRSLTECEQTADGTVFAQLIVDTDSDNVKKKEGGLPITVSFASPWPLAKKMLDGEVEARNNVGDAAYIQVEKLPTGKQLSELPSQFFTKSVLGLKSRFGAYGTPSDIKVVRSVTGALEGSRLLEVKFNALSPTYTEVPRWCLIMAVCPPNSLDVVMLVVGASQRSWKAGTDKQAQTVADSFRVTKG